MGRAQEVLRALRRSESGFSLTELLVVSAITVVLVGVAYTLFQVAARNEGTTSAKSANSRRAGTAMERMTRELRQGSSIVSSSPQQVTFETYVRGVGNRRVRFDCTSGTCTRAEAPSGTNTFAAPVTLVGGLADTNVFTFPSTRQVSLRLRLTTQSDPESGPGRTLTSELNDGVTLRNAP